MPSVAKEGILQVQFPGCFCIGGGFKEKKVVLTTSELQWHRAAARNINYPEGKIHLPVPKKGAAWRDTGVEFVELCEIFRAAGGDCATELVIRGFETHRLDKKKTLVLRMGKDGADSELREWHKKIKETVEGEMPEPVDLTHPDVKNGTLQVGVPVYVYGAEDAKHKKPGHLCMVRALNYEGGEKLENVVSADVEWHDFNKIKANKREIMKGIAISRMKVDDTEKHRNMFLPPHERPFDPDDVDTWTEDYREWRANGGLKEGGGGGGKNIIVVVKYQHQADVTLFVSPYREQADICVFKVDCEDRAVGDGNWFFVQDFQQHMYREGTYKKVFFTDMAPMASKRIYYEEHPSFARGRL